MCFKFLSDSCICSLYPIQHLLPDTSWKQVQCNHEEDGKYADYHKARINLMLMKYSLMLR